MSEEYTTYYSEDGFITDDSESSSTQTEVIDLIGISFDPSNLEFKIFFLFSEKLLKLLGYIERRSEHFLRVSIYNDKRYGIRNECFVKSGGQYIGEAVIDGIVKDYVHGKLKLDPQKRYKCAPFLVKQYTEPNISSLSEFYFEKDSEYHRFIENAYVIFKKDLNKMRDFLRLGIYDEEIVQNFDLSQYLNRFSQKNQEKILLSLEIFETFFTITDICYLCGRKHENPGFSPSVCSNRLCQYSLLNFRANTNLPLYIRERKEVCDFLISFASVSSKNGLFNPIPDGISDEEYKEFFEVCPPVFEMSYYRSENDFFKKLDDKKRKNFLKILTFILFGSKSQIIYMKSNCLNINIKGHIFYSQISNDAKEMRFRNHKSSQKMKSKYLWHGTRPNCLQSILHQGLKVLSGTQYMTAGQAYGRGIYFSHSFRTSSSYSWGVPNNYMNSELGRNLRVMIISEVLSENFHLHNNFCYVINDEEYVNFKFLIVHSNDSLPDEDINLDKIGLSFNENEIVDSWFRGI